jgi:hypothetical protein
VTGLNLSATGATIAARYGHMPHWWANWSHVSVNGMTPGHAYTLGGVVGQVQTTALPQGGPQGLEGYVYLSHPTGTTRLAIGTIGNVEVAGTGDVQEVRSLQAGGVLTGRGRVGRWTGLMIAVPHKADIREVVDIQFSNGWSLRANGDNLELWDTKGIVRLFR